jgi:hypothetical protein
MTTIFYHKRKCIQIPDNYDELSAKQFTRLASILFSSVDDIQARVRVLFILSGMNVFRFRLLKAEIIDRCLPFVEWVFEPRNITTQILPCYKGYHGPASEFENMKMKEFHLSELYYRQFLDSAFEDIEILNNLVAVLYRTAKKDYDTRRNPDGDIRVEFNHNEVPFHAKKISRWPAAVKQAIFLWYDGCRQQLIDDNPMVFKEPAKHGFESQFDTGLYGMMRNLAGEKLGSIDHVENMYVQTAMLELGLIKEEEKYIDEQLKSNRTP